MTIPSVHVAFGSLVLFSAFVETGKLSILNRFVDVGYPRILAWLNPRIAEIVCLHGSVMV